MFERFTNRARRVVVLAQEQARDLNHNYIGTEHLLLGLAKEDDGIAGRVLAAHGMPYEVVRQDVIDKVKIGKGDSPSGHIPFTPRAKKTLELSLREALQLNHNYIGTEHLLLGLIKEGDGVAAQVLSKHADLLAIRFSVLDLAPAGDPDDGKDKRASAAGRVLGMVRERLSGGRWVTEEERRVTATPAAEATVAEAARLAGTGPVGSHHLLLAALADPDSAAARALADLGVDLDQAKEALRAADVTGTTDEPPEIVGRRQMVIQVSDEVVTVVAVDPATVAAAKSALAAVNARAALTAVTTETGTAEKTGAAGEPTAEAGTSATATAIRGDHPAATSLSNVWLALNDSLAAIRRAAEPPQPAPPEPAPPQAA
jgi:ATP-dependent Clp protease ATP-binding subunit ClpA